MSKQVTDILIVAWADRHLATAGFWRCGGTDGL
jgi:hypothetical protein